MTTHFVSNLKIVSRSHEKLCPDVYFSFNPPTNEVTRVQPDGTMRLVGLAYDATEAREVVRAYVRGYNDGKATKRTSIIRP